MHIIFLSGRKYLWLLQYANKFLGWLKKCCVKFLGWLKKFGPAQNIFGTVKGQGISFCVKIETDFERFFLILHVIFLFFPVSGSFFCRFARAPHHENSLNLRWDWRTVLCRGQFMHFQSTSMNEKKIHPSMCFQQIGFYLFLAFIWIFQLLNRLNSKFSKLVIIVFPKTNIKRRNLRTFLLVAFARCINRWLKPKYQI